MCSSITSVESRLLITDLRHTLAAWSQTIQPSMRSRGTSIRRLTCCLNPLRAVAPMTDKKRTLRHLEYSCMSCPHEKCRRSQPIMIVWLGLDGLEFPRASTTPAVLWMACNNLHRQSMPLTRSSRRQQDSCKSQAPSLGISRTKYESTANAGRCCSRTRSKKL